MIPKFESYTGENEKIKEDIFKYKQEAGKAILHGELMTDGQLRAVLSEGSTINHKILRELIEFRHEKKKGGNLRSTRQNSSDGEDMLLNYGCYCLPSQEIDTHSIFSKSIFILILEIIIFGTNLETLP